MERGISSGKTGEAGSGKPQGAHRGVVPFSALYPQSPQLLHGVVSFGTNSATPAPRLGCDLALMQHS